MSSFEPLAYPRSDRSFRAADTGRLALFESVGERAGRAAQSERDREHEALAAELERAHERGLAEGRAAAEAELAEPIARSLEELASLQGAYLEHNRAGVVELAVAMAERVLRTSLSENAEALSTFLEYALAAAADAAPAGSGRESQELRVRVCDADRALLDGSSIGAPSGAPIAFEIDATLGRGDVIVQAGAAEVDARIEHLLAAVREAVLPAVALPVVNRATDGATDGARMGAAAGETAEPAPAPGADPEEAS